MFIISGAIYISISLLLVLVYWFGYYYWIAFLPQLFIALIFLLLGIASYLYAFKQKKSNPS